MSTPSATTLKWKVALPVILITAVSLVGLATRTLTWYQAMAVGPLLYSMAMFTIGAFAYRGQAAPDAEPIAESDLPMVSILIPAHNEEMVIANTVGSMLKLDYPRYEVIVIDDHSSDRTGDILRQLPVTTVTRRNLPNRGKSEALNAGLEYAQGDVICVFDADSEVAPDFLRLAVAPIVFDPEVCGVQTQVRMYNRRHNFLTAGQDDEFALYNELIQMGRSTLGLASALGGNGQLTRRSAIDAVGGWSPASLTEDLDLSMRLLLAGRGRIAHVSEASVWQEAVVNTKALIRQRTRWAEGMLRCFGDFAGQIVRSKQLRPAMRLDAIFVLISAFFPLMSLAGLIFSIGALVPGFILGGLPTGVSLGVSAISLTTICAWSASVSWKRERTIDLMPGFRYIVYALHWVPAVITALRNIMVDQPVVWEKTVHHGHGGLVSTTAPTMPIAAAAVVAEHS
ncbi:MAG: glycosyltransferase family 2 protein [Candidatus Sericytochromatia bacterium]